MLKRKNRFFCVLKIKIKYEIDLFTIPWGKLRPSQLGYRCGLNMVAIIFMTVTKYACNVSNDLDLICLQSNSKKGLHMLAMIIT